MEERRQFNSSRETGRIRSAGAKVLELVRSIFSGPEAADTGYEYALPFSNYEGPIDPMVDVVADDEAAYGAPKPKPPKNRMVL